MANIYNSQLDAFTLYHQVQESQSHLESFFSPSGTALPALGHAIAGSTGSALSNLCTYPLDLIITRLQIQRQLRKDQAKPDDYEYKGIEDAARKIYQNEGGLSAFYAGVWQDTGKTVADTFFFFLMYNFLRQKRLAARGSGSTVVMLPAIEELAVGFFAGSFSKLLTTPIANIVTRKQAAALTSAPSPESVKPPSTSQIAQDIFRQKGPLGFWSGYSASLVLTLNPSLTFFLFETFKSLLPRSRRDSPPPAATFLMAAISKACASSVTYPFSLAKSRAQVGGKEDETEDEKQEDKEMEETGVEKVSSKRAEKVAAQMTIFSTVLRIAETEGVHGLYEGLPLEIVKGFFSHGITMILKQAIHKMIVQAYYIMAIIVSKYRKRANPQKLAQRARQQSFEYYDLARARAEERIATAKEELQEAQKGVGDFVNSLGGGMRGAIDKANETAELVADYVEEEAEEWRSLYGTGLARWFEEK